MSPQEPAAIDAFYGAAGLLEVRYFSSHDASSEKTGWDECQQTQSVIGSYPKDTYSVVFILQRCLPIQCKVAAPSR
jgi:hypothetical protein